MPGRAEFITGRREVLVGTAATFVWFLSGCEVRPEEPKGQELSVQLGPVAHTYSAQSVDRRGNQIVIATKSGSDVVANGVIKDGERPLDFVQIAFVSDRLCSLQQRPLLQSPTLSDELMNTFHTENRYASEDHSFAGMLTVFRIAESGHIATQTFFRQSNEIMIADTYPANRTFRNMREVHLTERGFEPQRWHDYLPVEMGQDGVVAYLYENGFFKTN